jgi:pimeloyl-ACP methyl ester carboxylesterase
MCSRLITTRFGEIEYRSVGIGIPIVFIHGGHANCNEKLCHKGFHLEKYRLITPSRPGYGKTPLANNHTPDKAADLIAELMRQLSINKAIIYGVSAGGLTAIELAANHPDLVDKLILASAVSKKWLNTKDETYKIAQIIFNPRIEGFTWRMVGFFSGYFPGMIANSFFSQFSSCHSHKLRNEDIKELVLAFREYRSKKGFLNDIDQNGRDESLKRIIAPSLVIHSKNDKSVPYEHAVHSHKLIKRAKLIELDNEWGHLFWIGRDAHESIKKVIDFINE